MKPVHTSTTEESNSRIENVFDHTKLVMKYKEK